VTAISKFQVGLVMGCFIVASGCATKEGPTAVSTAPDVAITCIAVMPVQPSVEFEDITTPAEKKTLKDGGQIMNGLLKQYLTGKVNARYVTEGQGNVKESCNAVLETTLSQYVDRVGGAYGVKEPAAVTFTYRLYEASNGKVLCHGRFDEKQQSVMENLLTLPKAKSRGLTWLTAEELLRDGLQERLGQCSYLEGSK